MYILYNILLFILLIVYIPVILYKKIKGSFNKDIKERLGFPDSKKLPETDNRKVIWVHAVSVGETAAAEPVVSLLKEKHPEYNIVFSTVTETGQNMARQIINYDSLIYFPLDFSFSVHSSLQKINPDLVVIMETELWPNFIHRAHRQDSKIILVNGRISDQSYKRYKYLGPFLSDMLDKIDIFSMQSPRDVEYITRLGADADRVANSGNTKFDRKYEKCDSEQKKELYSEFKISPDQPVWVVGSTHPDEEKQLLPVYKKVKSEFPNLIMILAPRHIRRIDEIERLYQNQGLPVIKRSEIEERNKQQVILLDTIGELAQIYALGDLTFVGGSLVEKGGHNILEPLIQERPVFFGPHMFNFKNNTRLVLEYGAGIQISDTEELTEKMLYYLKNPEELSRMTDNIAHMFRDNEGAAQKNCQLIQRLLEQRKDS